MMSTVTPLLAEPVAVRAGADLREARERLGWSLDDVALQTRIRRAHLEALEDGRLSTLPGAAYALAFVRTYARALGLDAEETVRRFKTEAGEAGRRTELAFPMPVPERGLPAGAVMLLGVVLTIGAYVGWYRLSGDGRLPAETQVAVPAPLPPLAEQALPPGRVAEAVVAQADPVPAAAVVRGRDGSPMGGSGLSAQAATAPSAQPPVAPAQSAAALAPGVAAAPSVPPSAAAPAAQAGDDSRVVFRSNAYIWLMVRDKAGNTLVNKTLKPGETWPAPLRAELKIAASNGAGMDIVVDGTPVQPLGAAGQVRRDMTLDPDALRPAAPQVAASKPRQ